MNVIKITVEPHVSVYIRHHFGERIFLSEHNIITSILKSLLKPFDKVEPWKLKHQRKECLGSSVDICISDNMLRKYGASLSNEDILAFNESIDQLIKQEMYRWCCHPNATYKEVDYNIRAYIDFYGFAEDDLSFDNLKRWYYRERERIRKRKPNKGEDMQPTMVIPALITHQLTMRPVKQLAMSF